jgi:hypothetical protein
MGAKKFSIGKVENNKIERLENRKDWKINIGGDKIFSFYFSLEEMLRYAKYEIQQKIIANHKGLASILNSTRGDSNGLTPPKSSPRGGGLGVVVG